jgi:4-hydroxy-2-oxoheptanedioate aldolase
MLELEHHVRAADATGLRVLVRVSDAQSPDILRALDAGAHGIVVPHVRSAEDARRAASMTRYPPDGRRSLALSTRAGAYGTREMAEHLEAASRDVVLIAQLEDAEALGELPAIIAADGLAGIFIGPTDLSASLGHPGQLQHPRVREAIDQVAGAVLARPGLALCVIVGDEAEGRAWIDRGARLVLVNAPSLLGERLTSVVRTLRNASTPDGRPL